MSTRACIYEAEGTDPAEPEWELDLHEDVHHPERGLDVHAYDPQWNQRVECTLTVDDVRKLRDSLTNYLERNLL